MWKGCSWTLVLFLTSMGPHRREVTPVHCKLKSHLLCFNTLRPRQNGRHFPDDIFKWIFLNENVWILINISLKFVPKGPINNIPTLVQIMAWCRSGDKPLSESMLVSLPTHICVTRPQWVKLSLLEKNNGKITVMQPIMSIKICYFQSFEVCSSRFDWWAVIIDLNNGLAPNRWQAII